MAKQEQLKIIRRSVKNWNDWRKKYPGETIDLSKANLNGANLGNANLSRVNLSRADLSRAYLRGTDLNEADLSGVNLSETDLSGVNLSGADLNNANLSGADLRETNLNGANVSNANLSNAYFRNDTRLSGTDFSNADLSGADLRETYLIDADLSSTNLSGANLTDTDLSGANLSGANLTNINLVGANLSGANLSGANLTDTDLSGANLTRADLRKSLLIGTNFIGATLSDSNIYGIAAWNVQLENAVQKNLIITQYHEAIIAIDNLKVAQFIYLMLDNKEIRDILDTIAKKAILILGRFTFERKVILDELREVLRAKGYIPILFDFQGPTSQDITSTISTLAHISRFIIADLTDPSCSPYEIGLIAPCRKPIIPIFQPSEKTPHEFSTMKDLRKRNDWILPTYYYNNPESLLTSLQETVIDPTEEKVKELERE